MIKLRLAGSATADLRDIRRFSRASFGERQAREYLDGLQALITLLRERPLIGPLQAHLGDGIRRMPYRSHRVYYRSTPGLVTVARILHHAQDEPPQFSRP